MMALHRLRPFLPLLAGGLFFLGERVLPASPGSPYFSGAGAVLLVLAVLWPALLGRLPSATAAGVRGRWSAVALTAMPPALFALAALSYFAARALPNEPPGPVDWAALLGWGWLLAVLLGACMSLLIELCLWGAGPTGLAETARLRRAASAGLALGLLLALVVTLNFIFNRLPWQWDLAYFKTASPTEATRELADGLPEKVEVGVFFPEHHLVLSSLQGYLENLSRTAPQLAIQEYDADLQPAQARRFRAKGNGWVVLRRDEVFKEISIGTNLKRARKPLQTFDNSFFSALVEVSREKRVAYLTVGHGERNEAPASRTDPRTGTTALRTVFAARNFKVKNLGAAQGLANEIPADAALVVIMAPAEPFLPGELQALRGYLDQGGRLLVFLDPEQPRRVSAAAAATPNAGLRKLLAGYGIDYTPVVHAHERAFARRTFSKADRALLVTVGYQTHPAVKTVRRKPRQNAVLLLGAGAWKKGKTPAHLRVQEVLKGMAGTWADHNGNFTFEEGAEKRGQPTFAMAISPRKQKTKEETRGPHILAFADAEIALDMLMQNRANRLVLADGIGWLASGDLPAGLPSKQEDVRIRHVKGDELAWFYLPVFAVPLAVLALGFWVTGRQGRRRRG